MQIYFYEQRKECLLLTPLIANANNKERREKIIYENLFL